MLKAQVFKTYDGAWKRARFENAHPTMPGYRHTVRKMEDGTYRLERYKVEPLDLKPNPHREALS